jgi:hypothetical protein
VKNKSCVLSLTMVLLLYEEDYKERTRRNQDEVGLL